jgi:hypothetical protein
MEILILSGNKDGKSIREYIHKIEENINNQLILRAKGIY